MKMRLAAWGVGLTAFGCVAAVAGYAGAVGPPQTDHQRIESLEKDLWAAEARLVVHNTKINDLQVKLAALEFQVSHLPKPPPSTTPVCASASLSRNPQGGERDCTPYLCDASVGTCRAGFCASVDDCATPYVCDFNNHCVTAR
jgi:hypothetical protein